MKSGVTLCCAFGILFATLKLITSWLLLVRMIARFRVLLTRLLPIAMIAFEIHLVPFSVIDDAEYATVEEAMVVAV